MRKVWTQREKEKLMRYVENKTNNEIALLFDTTKASIEHALKRFGITRKDNKYKQKDIRYVEKQHNLLSTPCHNCISHQISPNGYPMKKVKGKKELLARFVYTVYHNKEIPKGLVLRHKCDNKLCINPLHLEIGTHKDNIQDNVERGLQVKGSKINTAKLNESKVREIKIKLLDFKRGDIKNYHMSIMLVIL